MVISKNIIKKILIGVVILFVVIQFFRPEKNIATADSPNAIGLHYPVPEDVNALLRTSCTDCHSNNTRYPWYSNIQPVAWWLQDHVDEGKRKFNFDEFNSYDAKKKQKKLKEVVEMIEEDEMPLTSYTLIHRTAALSAQDKAKIIAWAKALQVSIK